MIAVLVVLVIFALIAGLMWALYYAEKTLPTSDSESETSL